MANEKQSSDFSWCLHCERAFQYGTERIIDGLKYCHYEGCDGLGMGDLWEWEKVRLPYEGDPGRETYPEIPELGEIYPLYSEMKKSENE